MFPNISALSHYSSFFQTFIMNQQNHYAVNQDYNPQYFADFGLKQLTDSERTIFFILYLVTFSLSMIANIATLCTTYQRKMRLIQKTLIISLALSDIVVCIFLGVNNIINFSHAMVNWILGEFMCAFVPYMQILGSLANSLTMISIAFDRYRNIVFPLSKQWDPNIWKCIAVLLVLWCASAGVAYPMYDSMILTPIITLITDPYDPSKVLSTVPMYLCSPIDKNYHLIYFSTIFALIFAPIMTMFLWMYYKIAKLIWLRRKPLKSKTNECTSVTMETSTDSKTSVTKSPIASQIHRRMKSMIKNNNTKLHMEKKIRTFKIILIIMLVFFICRMPYWLFKVIKFSIVLDKPEHWVLANVFSFLIIINTLLNPFLYSFLNQTLMYFDKFFISLGDFISNICCCCCTNTEFDDFEKDNPFVPEGYDARPSQTSSIIPRGPYLDYKQNNNHVKFHDVAIINMYPKESSQNCNTF